MGSINSYLVRANTPAWGQKKTLESDSSRVVLEAKRKTLSSQVQGSRSMTEGGADAPSICSISSSLAGANTPMWGQFSSYWLAN